MDYLIQRGKRVVPVEVKAQKSGRLKSLQVFVQEKRTPLSLRFNDSPPSLLTARTSVPGKEAVPFTLLSLPLYLVEQTSRLIVQTGCQDPTRSTGIIMGIRDIRLLSSSQNFLLLLILVNPDILSAYRQDARSQQDQQELLRV